MEDIVRQAAEPILRQRDETAVAVREVPGGANSRAFLVEAAAGARYLAKSYLDRPGDPQDRLGVEFGALTFLWDNGVRCVPEPVGADSARRVALYGYIDGKKLAPGEVTANDVRQAVDFLRSLHALRGAPGAADQPEAKESCFTLVDYLAVVGERLERLRLIPDDAESSDLRRWLNEVFEPSFRQTAQRVRAEAATIPWPLGAPLSPGRRTLSPSDVGFHNALRRPDGTVIFIDFEYWGWDDPAKTLADFFLQPAVPVPMELHDAVLTEALGFYDDPTLPRRYPLVRELLAHKWCLIMLNAFHRPERRPDWPRQLDKARRYLTCFRAGGTEEKT